MAGQLSQTITADGGSTRMNKVKTGIAGLNFGEWIIDQLLKIVEGIRIINAMARAVKSGCSEVVI